MGRGPPGGSPCRKGQDPPWRLSGPAGHREVGQEIRGGEGLDGFGVSLVFIPTAWKCVCTKVSNREEVDRGGPFKSFWLLEHSRSPMVGHEASQTPDFVPELQ